MKRLYPRLFSISLAGMCLLPFSGCASQVKIPEVPAQAGLKARQAHELRLSAAQERSLGLLLEPVRQVPMEETVETTGQVQAAIGGIAHVYAPISGPVTSVPVTLGQSIGRGQVLATLKSDEIGQMQADLLQQIMQIEADLQQAKAQLELSRITYQRETRLYNERISARADMESARTSYEKDQAIIQSLEAKARAAITAAQSRMALYGAAPGAAAKVARQKQLYPYVTLTAPRGGTLINQTVNMGELATMDKELFTVADLHRVWLVGNLYEQDISKVRLGQKVRVTLDSIPNRVFPGKVSYVGSVLDPQSRTLEVRIDTDNPDLCLKPNMFARIVIENGQHTATAVPSSAIQRNGDYAFVYVPVLPQVYIERRVTTGVEGNGMTEILEGIRPGEQVVAHGTLALKGEFQKLDSQDAGL